MKIVVFHLPYPMGNYKLNETLANKLTKDGHEVYLLQQLNGHPYNEEYYQQIKLLDPDILYYEMLDKGTFEVVEKFKCKKILNIMGTGILKENFKSEIKQYKDKWYTHIITNSKEVYNYLKNDVEIIEFFEYYFCALTDDDETNLMSSLLAKKMGAKKTMIILNNPSYLGLVPGFIDIYVAPYRLTVSSVLQDLRDSDVTQDVMLKMDTGAEAVEGIVHANEYTSSLFGKSIKEISLPEGASIGAVIRHGELIMPRSEVELCLNDHLIIFLANKNMMSEVEVLFKTN